MISANYVQQMARYNAWQYEQMIPSLDALDDAALRQDRGAFFGSIFATVNHLLWGDRMWLNRFDETIAPPDVPAAEHAAITPDLAVWKQERAQTDKAMINWSNAITDGDLTQDLLWYAGLNQKEQSLRLAECVVHFFNHQTHHRGQIHAMLTATGQAAPVSDLIFMPGDR